MKYSTKYLMLFLLLQDGKNYGLGFAGSSMSDSVPPLWINGHTNPDYLEWYQRNRPHDWGAPSDFGNRWCHGCNAGDDGWVDPDTLHSEDCPRQCIRDTCTWHRR